MRTPHELDRLADALDPTRIFCFLPFNGLSHCNSHAQCFAAALGVPFAPPGSSANEQHAWLCASKEWRRATPLEAATAANLGKPVVAAWSNPPGHGHIGWVLPGSSEASLVVTAAGRRCFKRAPMEKSFGLAKPDLFTTE